MKARGLWLLILFWVGCAAPSSRLPRLDLGAELETFYPTTVGGYTYAQVDLSQPGIVRKIVIRPRVPLRKLSVQVRTLDGSWQSIATLEGRFTQSVTVEANISGDAVRVVDQMPSKKVRGNPFMETVGGPIETILVYGFPIPEGALNQE